MKRLQGFFLLIAGAFVHLAGCEKKEVETLCYECEMTYTSGQPAGTQYPCTADIATWQKEQKDNNGQAISSECREK